MPERRTPLSPSQVLVLSLLALIGAGTLLLRLPIAAQGEPLSFIDAFFTSTSAVCVTGLIVNDTPSALSVFGQVVVMLLIQAGGLGYMTISTILAIALGRQLSVQERLTLQEALNVDSMEGLVRFTLRIFRLTLAFELAGAAVLALRWSGEMGIGKAAYFGIFHAVSAFNNAGFALFPDNLIRYRGDWVVNAVICTLIIVGGIGFVVLTELGALRRGRRLSVHSRLVLTMTALLVVLGAAAIFVLEIRNPRTLGPLGLPERVLASVFQSVSPRTAGFNTVDIAALTEPALFLTMALMFIGAAPGGTGGGVKVTTFSIVVAALWATVRGVEEPVIFKRRIPLTLVSRAFFINLIAFLALNVVAALLLVAERRPLLSTLFETISAFGTVGLSMGVAGAPYSLAGAFSAVGKLLLALAMFMGRVGPLTAAVALARTRRTGAHIRYAEGRFLVG
jgi:trk system potassium uptake protein TrkH